MSPAPPPVSPPVSPTKARKHPRRSHRKSPPTEIRFPMTAQALAKNNVTEAAAAAATATALAPMATRKPCRHVRLLPGSAYTTTTTATTSNKAVPAPPTTTPPRPTALLSLLLVGPDETARRALVDPFVGSTTSSPTASSSSTAETPSNTTAAWSVEYHKKDWAYHSACRRGRQNTAPRQPQCVRLQLWNVTAAANDSGAPNAPPDAAMLDWPVALQKRSQHAVLVVALEYSTVAALRVTVTAWKHWLDVTLGGGGGDSDKQYHNTVQLVVTVPASNGNHGAAFFMRTGVALHQLAADLEVPLTIVQTFKGGGGEASSLAETYATWVTLTEHALAATAKRPTATVATSTSTPKATAKSLTPGAQEVAYSSSASPGTIVVDAHDVIPITPHHHQKEQE